jgi:CheY-like chemotaxis protein
MTSIHDDEPGSRSDAARTANPALRSPLTEWERLARRRDELETVLGAGHIGYCRLRAAGRVLEANSQFKAEWGWPPDEVLSWEAVESRVDVGDRGRFDEAVRQALAGAAPLDVTVRVRPGVRNEDVRWLALRGCVVSCGDDAGSADLVITSRNVTSEHRAKDEFLSVISHELRSPLNAILGWNRILALKCGQDPEVAALASRVEQSARAQLRMLNDLLDFKRAGTGKLKVEAAASPAARVDSAEGEPPQQLRTLEGLSFLVVDDELEARTTVAEMLQLEGASVTVTDSAPAALRQLQAQGARFDIMVTDIGMPEEDGYSLVRKLRSSREGKRMLAIAVTGHASRSDVAAAMDAGFDLHVPKPVDFETFVPLVRRLAVGRASSNP